MIGKGYPLEDSTMMNEQEIRSIIISSFLRRKDAIAILGEGFIPSPKAIYELTAFFKQHNYAKQWEAKIRNLAYFVKNNLDDYAGRIVLLRKLKRNSLEWHVALMGISEGTTSYERLCDNVANALKSIVREVGSSSLSAKRVFDALAQEFSKENIDLIYDDGNHKEWRRKDQVSGKVFAYDCKVRSHKLVIEYNGEHIHPRKGKLSEEQWSKWRNRWTGATADESYTFDKMKNDALVDNGYQLLLLWHADGFNHNFNIACDWLKNNLNLETLEIEKKKVRCRRFLITKPDGSTEIVTSLKKFISRNDHPLTGHQIGCILSSNPNHKGKKKTSFEGWKIEYYRDGNEQ